MLPISRTNIPQLDDLDSPMISPAFTSSGQHHAIQGSALAERIFNDPGSWDNIHLLAPPDEDMMLMERMIDEFPSPYPDDWDKETTSNNGNSPSELTVPGKRQERLRSTPKPIAVLLAYIRDPPGKLDAQREGIDDDGTHPALLSTLLNPQAGDFNTDLQIYFAHIVSDENGIPHPALAPPMYSPSSSSEPSSSLDGSHAGDNKPIGLSPLPSASSIAASPFKVHSASTTLSFLEWYGIPAESPLYNVTSPSFVHSSRPLPKSPSSSEDVLRSSATPSHVSSSSLPPTPPLRPQDDSQSPTVVSEPEVNSSASIPTTLAPTPSKRNPPNITTRKEPQRAARALTASARKASQPTRTPSLFPPPCIPLPEIPSEPLQTKVPPSNENDDAPSSSSPLSKSPHRRLPSVPLHLSLLGGEAPSKTPPARPTLSRKASAPAATRVAPSPSTAPPPSLRRQCHQKFGSAPSLGFLGSRGGNSISSQPSAGIPSTASTMTTATTATTTTATATHASSPRLNILTFQSPPVPLGPRPRGGFSSPFKTTHPITNTGSPNRLNQI